MGASGRVQTRGCTSCGEMVRCTSCAMQVRDRDRGGHARRAFDCGRLSKLD